MSQEVKELRQVEVLTLDSIIGSSGVKGDKLGLIVDVQGSELAVLRGLSRYKDQVDVAIIEVSTFPRYGLPWDLKEVLSYFLPDFTIWQVNPFLTGDARGSQDLNPFSRVLEMDLFFVKTNSESFKNQNESLNT